MFAFVDAFEVSFVELKGFDGKACVALSDEMEFVLRYETRPDETFLVCHQLVVYLKTSYVKN